MCAVSNTCALCPAPTPLRPDGEPSCVECVSNTDCLVDDECTVGNSCADCPAPTPFRPTSSPSCAVCGANAHCDVDEECDNLACQPCPSAAPRRPLEFSDCGVECIVNIDCPVNQECLGADTCANCPLGMVRTETATSCAFGSCTSCQPGTGNDQG